MAEKRLTGTVYDSFNKRVNVISVNQWDKDKQGTTVDWQV